MMISAHSNHSNTCNFSQDLESRRNYIHALEEERRKIQVFQRELPLSLELVQQAIETCKQQLSVEFNLPDRSECSEQTTSSDVPVFEEFIPMKRASSEEHESDKQNDEDDDDDDVDNGKAGNDENSQKSDWLRSVQLWNQTPDPSLKEDSNKKAEVKKGCNNGAFHPFKKDATANGPPPPPPPPPSSSTAENGGSKKDEKDGNRKARRCWSPELHRRFLHALQQLGGSHVATPKQIRELMKVDGLTNDEVKSHLQKYRLHTRSPSPTIPTTAAQPPQFVVVGGIWVPPEYATMATTATSGEAPSGIYTPIATLPPPFKDVAAVAKKRQVSDGSGGARGRSNSPATSSSTHITAPTATSPDC